MSACPFCPKGPDIVRLTQRPQRGWERKGIFFVGCGVWANSTLQGHFSFVSSHMPTSIGT